MPDERSNLVTPRVAAADSEFFVGYLPTPPRLRWFLRIATLALLLLAAATAAVIASRMRDPGDGKREFGKTASVEGIIVARPYPMLWTGREMILLAGDGKVAATVARELEGKYVAVTGSPIERAGRRMIELAGGGAGAIRALDGLRVDVRDPDIARQRDPVQLAGEIIDARCYLGAMKPGDGKPHKACAALCLRGGIPPMLRTTLPNGRERLTLLAGVGLSPVAAPELEPLIRHAGERVMIEGMPVEFGDLHVLEIRPDSVRRQ